jgi:hypothetical protein
MALAVLALSAQAAGACIREVWASSKLLEKADLVVIARLTSTRDSPNSDKPPALFPNLVGVDSTFHVLAVLKGKARKKELVLFHFRYRTEKDKRKPTGSGVSPRPEMVRLVSLQTPEIDGPGLLDFGTRRSKEARYLLFLKKRRDGRYECVSGQIDPDVSVSGLDGPSDDDLEPPPMFRR